MKRIITAIMLMACVCEAQIPDSTMMWLRQAGVGTAASVAVGWADPMTYATYWNMETTNATSTLDVSGNNVSATNIPNMATGASWKILATNQYGRVSHNYYFGGTNQRFATASHILTGATLTVGCWIYPNEVTSVKSFVNKWQWTSPGGWYLGNFHAGAQRITFAVDNGNHNGGQSAESGNILIATNWQSVVGVFSNATINLYYNGVIVNTTTSAVGGLPTVLLTNSCPIDIGYFQGVGRYMAGNIDEAFISSQAWTPNQIAAWHTNTIPTNNIRIYP